MEAETCRELFCNADGIMLADGLVWIAEVVDSEGISTLKVVTIYA